MQARRFIAGYARAPASTVGSVLCTDLETGRTVEGVDSCEVRNERRQSSYCHHVPDCITCIDESIAGRDHIHKIGVSVLLAVQIGFERIPDSSVDTLVEEGTLMWCAGGLMIEHPLVSPHITFMHGAQYYLAHFVAR